ncbi:MAG: hypothetical protein CME34_06165 [Gordonia sp.]|nr:hypothetical protein [Gordonia sp. (in: high G+C Gram-positive bacteria)]
MPAARRQRNLPGVSCSRDVRNVTLEHVERFEAVETRGHVENGQVAHFQVTLKVRFRLNEA